MVPTSQFIGGNPSGQAIQLSLEESSIAESENTPVKIKARVTLPFDFDQPLEFQWRLTEDLVLNSGSLKGTLTHLKANIPETIEISVKGFVKKENRQVSFKITGVKNDQRISADGIVSSLKDESFENIVQNVEKIRTENAH